MSASHPIRLGSGQSVSNGEPQASEAWTGDAARILARKHATSATRCSLAGGTETCAFSPSASALRGVGIRRAGARPVLPHSFPEPHPSSGRRR